MQGKHIQPVERVRRMSVESSPRELTDTPSLSLRGIARSSLVIKDLIDAPADHYMASRRFASHPAQAHTIDQLTGKVSCERSHKASNVAALYALRGLQADAHRWCSLHEHAHQSASGAAPFD